MNLSQIEFLEKSVDIRYPIIFTTKRLVDIIF